MLIVWIRVIKQFVGSIKKDFSAFILQADQIAVTHLNIKYLVYI